MITDMLKKHAENEKASFHMPGHKNGVGFLGAPFSADLFAMDTTELPGTDALIAPEGAILEAEQYAAGLYGAKHSFFLVGGATVGILSMIYSAFRPNDRVIIDRNCHQSVLNGAILAGVNPIYVTPEISPLPDIPGTVSAQSIEKILKQHSDIKGAILTSPNYFGATADIKSIAALLHEHQALLLVDEAHGAHFPFSPAFPESSIRLGADMSVVSLHKTLPAPNQTALLNINNTCSLSEVRDVIRMFQTSSPSYPLLAAMEYGLSYAEKKGKVETARILSLLNSLGCPTLNDPFKLMPTWAEKGNTGYQAEKILRERFGIYVEMCTSHRVLCMVSWCNTDADIQLLQKALGYLNALPSQGEALTVPDQKGGGFSLPQISPAELRKFAPAQLPLDRSSGKICAKTVAAFPPCIPILLPGEVITDEKIAYLKELKKNKSTITGMVDDNITILS